MKGPAGDPQAAKALAAAAFLGPLWASAVPGLEIVTVGRVLLVVIAVVVLYDLIRLPSRARDVTVAGWPLFLLVAAALVWIGINLNAWGCNCAGSVWPTTELAAACCLAVAACTFDPARGSTVLIASAVGVALGGALALVGIRDLNSALVGAPTSGTRLEGIYGNSNFLAYAVAFCVPVLVALSVARRRVPVRLFLLAALSGVTAVLILTFSRGGLLAAAAGGVAAGALAVGSNRRDGRTAAVGAALLAITAIMLYPLFSDHRTQADFAGAPSTASAPPDRSGWDPGAQGVIPRGGSRLTNVGDDVLQVRSPQAGQGTSFPLDPLGRGEEYILEFKARSPKRPIDLLYALEDNRAGLGPATAEARVGRRWKALRLRWRPTAASVEARLYVWQNVGPSAFRIQEVAVQRRTSAGQWTSLPITVGLIGPKSVETVAEQRRTAAALYVESRLAGVELGIQAFLEHPLRGIGWERFPAYAGRHGEFGGLPTHNEYIRVLAELGLPGVVIFMALLVIVAMATFRVAGLARVLATGILVTGAVGLLFVNGLGASSASLPVALAAGTMVALRHASAAAA